MSREELLIEIDLLKGNINTMMITDDVEEFGNAYNYATKSLSTIFLENLRRIVKEEDIKNQILEESAEVESEYSVDSFNCIKDCSTCKYNIEFPPPHTCDICTSLEQEKPYEMWEEKENTNDK